jgi:hypothetical protein
LKFKELIGDFKDADKFILEKEIEIILPPDQEEDKSYDGKNQNLKIDKN